VHAVERDHRRGIRHDGSVPRQDRGDRAVAGEGPDPLERVEVCRELTVGVRHHRRAPTEHRVAGEQRVVGRQREGDRVGRVPRGGHDTQVEAPRRDEVTVGEVVVAGADRAHP
jgi:hypothetical protein